MNYLPLKQLCISFDCFKRLRDVFMLYTTNKIHIHKCMKVYPIKVIAVFFRVSTVYLFQATGYH